MNALRGEKFQEGRNFIHTWILCHPPRHMSQDIFYMYSIKYACVF